MTPELNSSLGHPVVFQLLVVRDKFTDPGGLEVEPSLGVRTVAGSIPSRDISKVVKRWYRQLPCLHSALKGECLEIWLVGPVSAYNVTGWGDPVEYLQQDRSSVTAL